MSLDDLQSLTEVFGAGGGLLVALGMLAVGVLFPVLKRERDASKKATGDLVKDADILVFMTAHELRVAAMEQRLDRIERKLGD